MFSVSSTQSLFEAVSRICARVPLESMGQHDLSYRLFFSHRRMVQDLLQKIVAEPWADLIDFDSGERVSSSYVSDGHDNRESDIVWRFRRKDGSEPAEIYILIELQSRPDPSMPVRFTVYKGLLYQNLLADLPPAAWKKLPPILAVLIYNGAELWNVATDLGSVVGDLDPSAEIYRPRLRYRLVDESAYDRQFLETLNSPVADLFYIEKSGNWGDVLAGVQRLRRNIPLEESSLRRAFATWLQKVILPRFGLSLAEVSDALTLEEVETMLAESIDRWNREIREQGREEGRQEGEARILLRLLRLKFGTLAPEVEERVLSTDVDRLEEWSERVLTAQRLQDVFGE
jgi:Putative transposase, YhgA-like/Domain of unknown function (DUF4351)